MLEKAEIQGKMVNTDIKKKREKSLSSDLRSIICSPWFSAALIFLMVSLCLAVGFSQKPCVYPIDYGQYEHLLKQYGLTWTEEDIVLGNLQYSRPITEFAYTHFSWSNLLTPLRAGSLVYLIAVVRLFTEPFGNYFSVDGVAFISAVIMAFSVTLITCSLRKLLPRGWAVPAAAFSIMAVNGNFCALFRSLYSEGPAIVFTLLFIAVVLYTWSIPKELRMQWIIPVNIVSILLLKSYSQMVVFLIPVIAVNICLFFTSKRLFLKNPGILIISLIIFLSGITSSVRLLLSDPDLFSNASIYESVFNTMLPAADDPELLLMEFGLDETYADDIGKSYYQEESNYVHDPRDPEEAEFIFTKIKADDVLLIYLLHPDILRNVIRQIPVSLNNGFENSRNHELIHSTDDFAASRTESGLIFTLWQLLPHSYILFLIAQVTVSVFILCWAVFRKKYSSFCLVLFFVSSVAFLPLSVILNGFSQAQQYMLYQVFLTLILWAELIIGFILILPIITQWLTRFSNDPYVIQTEVALPVQSIIFHVYLVKTLKKIIGFCAKSRIRLVVLTALAAFLMLALTFIPIDHPVSINNGDYGRMMEQMNLTWAGNVYFDTDAQAGQYAIEEFGYTHSWDILKLTPIKPTFSLYWFVSIVRLLTEPFGKPFSTLLLAWVMGIISVLCITMMVYDLYPLLKKWTLIVSFLLCIILCSETYLTWYNALYGEGCIMLGLLLSLMSIIHLCVMPKKEKNWKKTLWMMALILSLNIMVTSKSQMLLTLPGAVLVFLALNIYHRQYRYDYLALQLIISLLISGFLIYSGFVVYQSERTEESVSQKHTMWQAYFYGIFMISDDPIRDMEELGVDTAMAPDIGKYVQFADDSWYVYAPLSKEAEVAFYDHVSMLTIIKWYLTHPTKLWYMMDHASKEAKSLYTGFRIYNGQNYSHVHDEVDGLNLWPGWRSYWTPGTFLGYVVFYGILLYFLLRQLLDKNIPEKVKIYCCIPLFLIVTGVIQFPLSVIGNGFVDNQKQMFGFALCHDLLMTGVFVLCARYLYYYTGQIHTSGIMNKLSDMKLLAFWKRSRSKGKKELQLNPEESNPNEKPETVNAAVSFREKESASGENA